MKISKSTSTNLTTIGLVGSFVIVTALTALSQSAPFLTVAPMGANQLTITITNGVGGADYELWWTPVLANPDFPWTTAAVGTPGQTNFTVNIGTYSSGFYQAVLDTNAIPLWEAADPNNPAAGVLTVYIDSPANNFNITQ